MIEVTKNGFVKKVCSYPNCLTPESDVVVSTPSLLTMDGEVVQVGMEHYHAECASRLIYELRNPTPVNPEENECPF